MALSLLPALRNEADDCYFHCGLEWAGPGGWSLENEGAQGNPLSNFATFDNTRLVVPSGASNGTVGQVSVTAFYSQCGFGFNTSNSATLYYGTPITADAAVNGSPAQSFNRVPNGQAFLNIQSIAGSAGSWTWQIDGGSGNLQPNGNGNSCNVSI